MSDFKNAIERDLDLVILEREYPLCKEALEIKYSDIGYEEIKRTINEISSRTFTAARLLARAQHKYTDYMEGTYEVAYAKCRNNARKKLNDEWNEKKIKATLTEKVIEDYVMMHYRQQILPLKKHVSKLQRDIDVLKALHKRLEMRETLLQTYSRLHERRTQIIMTENKV